MTPAEIDVDAEEKAAIVAEWRRLAAEPPPFNPRPYGCLVFLVAGALLLLIPYFSKWLGRTLPEPWGMVVSAVLVLVLVVGFFCGVFVVSGVYGRAYSRANVSLGWLSSHASPTEAAERRRHAVALIFNALVSDGPSSSSTVTAAQARERLGANLPYVLAVERELVAQKLTSVWLAEH